MFAQFVCNTNMTITDSRSTANVGHFLLRWNSNELTASIVRTRCITIALWQESRPFTVVVVVVVVAGAAALFHLGNWWKWVFPCSLQCCNSNNYADIWLPFAPFPSIFRPDLRQQSKKMRASAVRDIVSGRITCLFLSGILELIVQIIDSVGLFSCLPFQSRAGCWCRCCCWCWRT